MGEAPTPAEVAASEKAASEQKAKEAQEAAEKEAAAVPKVDLTEKPSAAEDLISKANSAAARIEEANKRTAELVTKQEALQVEQTLGGKADAGEGNKEETPKEYKDRIMGGEEEKKEE